MSYSVERQRYAGYYRDPETPQGRPLGRGPTGIAPPWRKHGFHSFQGLGALGFDKLSGNSTSVFMASIASVRGLRASGSGGSSPDAPLVKQRINEYMRAEGFRFVESGWATGGRVWLRYTIPSGTTGQRMISDSSFRRGRVQAALEAAARSLGPNVSFDVDGLGRIPSSAPSASREETGGVITELAPIDISAQIPTTAVNVRELQTVLRAKGFNPGTVDGKWGPNTSGALNLAAARLGRPIDPPAVGSADKRSVQIPTAVWGATAAGGIRGLPAGTPPSQAAAPAPAPIVTDIAPELGGGGVPDWLPWTIGAAALLGVGGFFVWKGRKRGGAVAANRRRRRRSSRRR